MTSPKLTRAIELLKLLSSSKEPVTLKKLGGSLQLEPSMLSRLVTDLTALGLVEKSTYRTISVTPELVQLGFNAADALPAAQTFKKLLAQNNIPPGTSAVLASIVMGKLFFFHRSGRKEAFSAQLEHSDLAAMIAAQTENFPYETIPDADRSAFCKRAAEAQSRKQLSEEHAGRSRQLVLPVIWHGRPCAVGFLSENPSVDMDRLFICGARIAAKLRDAGE